MTYILRHFAFWREPGHVIIRLSLIFLFKSCLPWYWSKMTTVNSLIVTTFRKRPPPVSDHFKNNRFVSQSNTVSNTTPKLALFQISCYCYCYHKIFYTYSKLLIKYARVTLDPSQGVNYYEIKFSRLDKQGKPFSRLGAEIWNCIPLCIRKLIMSVSEKIPYYFGVSILAKTIVSLSPQPSYSLTVFFVCFYTYFVSILRLSAVTI